VTDLSEFLRHIVGLNYNERPDYNHCRSLFTRALKSIGAKPTDKLDFGPSPVIKSTPKVILQLSTLYALHYVLLLSKEVNWLIKAKLQKNWTWVSSGY